VLKELDEATVETLGNIQKLLESVASFIESMAQERDTAGPLSLPGRYEA
jgi:hypothetical protein